MIVSTATLRGVHSIACHVDVGVTPGLPGFNVAVGSGFNESAVTELRVRMRGAIVQSGFAFPTGSVVAAVGPSHVAKHGTQFDLPVALSLLGAVDGVATDRLADAFVVGELAMDGRVQPVRGVLSAVELARELGKLVVVVPHENGAEAALVDGVTVRTVKTLKDAVAYFNGDDTAAPIAQCSPLPQQATDLPDFKDVRGQPFGRRMMEIAAAGGHHILLVGGPSAGKTMLARRLPGILPDLTADEMRDVARVSSAAGLTIGGVSFRRPFRVPHHTTSPAGLVGGGAPIARPGELSLAHRGVLVLDELPEFSRQALEYLREPLATDEVQLCRGTGVVCYPAAAQLVGGMNPCPCGQLGSVRGRCRCQSARIASYRNFPIRDAFDMRVSLPDIDFSTISSTAEEESSAVIRARVTAARARQMANQGKLNAKLDASDIAALVFEPEAKADITRAVQARDLTHRDFLRVCRVARTIADLAGADAISRAHAAEALTANA